MKLLTRFAIALVLAGCGAVAAVLACGPHYRFVVSTRFTVPPDLDAYARGELGIVRPTFERTFLVQAYRQISGLPAAPALTTHTWELSRREENGLEAWKRVPGATAVHQGFLDRQSYFYVHNCPDDAFATAARTYEARAAKYGAQSGEVGDWIAAQNAVFANCVNEGASLPAPAAPNADPLVRADREYQTAAAYFYQRKFDEAVTRFEAIAENADSPWRSYGRYLAARAIIRNATLFDHGPAKKQEMLVDAVTRLWRLNSEPSARHLQASIRGLIQFIDSHTRPIERLQQLARDLATKRELADQEILDFRLLMDRVVGDTVEYEFDRARLTPATSEPLFDWIVTMQGSGDGAVAHAVREWKETKSELWLVATLWRIPPTHADAPAALAAAERVETTSPAFASVAFLRARLLAARGERREARALLAMLPTRPAPGFPAETLNLVDAMRFALAGSMEELLTVTARRPIGEDRFSDDLPLDKPVFDQDAVEVFNYRLPLSRWLEAAHSKTLPARLRLRVVSAAFTRAILLGRTDDAMALVPALSSLAPALKADLERFASAPDAESRRIAAARFLLRTPGMHISIRGREDEIQYARPEPKRRAEHANGSNWWCPAQIEQPKDMYPRSPTLRFVYGDATAPAPSFLTAAERAQAQKELDALGALGAASTWLGKEAIRWATARPKDEEAAEALARAVEAARWGCWNGSDPATSRRAFQTLHKLYPKTEWARRTKYWY